MKDAYGNELNVGDRVVFVTGISFSRKHHLRVGKLTRVTATAATVEPESDTYAITKYRARYRWEDPDSFDFEPQRVGEPESSLVRTSARLFLLEAPVDGHKVELAAQRALDVTEEYVGRHWPPEVLDHLKGEILREFNKLFDWTD